MNSQRCEEVTISDGKIDFTQFKGDHMDGHLQRQWWTKRDEDVIELIHEHMDEYNQCHSDEEKLEFIRELVREAMPYGDCHFQSDYDDIEFHNTFFTHVVDPTTPEQYLKDWEEVVFLEDYPYRYGTYSGTINLETLEVEDVCVDGDSSPCGGPNEIYIHVPSSILEKVWG